MGTQAKARKQVRSFVLIWILVTLMMGACTFAAIYAAYGVVIEGEIGDTVASNEAADVVQVDNALATQAFPTRSSVAMASGQQSASVDQNADQVGRASVDAQAAANDGGDSDDNGEVVAVQPTAAEPTVASQPTEEDPFAGAADALREAAEQQAQSAPTNPPPTEPPPPTTEPTPLPVNVTDFQLGIQVQAAFDADMGLWMGEVDKLGMDWVKIQVRWENIEEVQGEYNWAAVDNAVNAAAERDIKVLASVVTAPDWAREPGVDLSQHGPPADYQVFADFVGTLLQRHPGKIHAVEVWNEQNLDREWTSVDGIVPADYVDMLRVTYQTIKDIDPGIVVISGALSPTGVDNRVTVWNDFAHLEAMIEAGMLNYADCVGAHHNGINVSPNVTWDEVPNDPSATFRGPFDNPDPSWSFRSTLIGYDFRIKQAGGDEKLCVTEFGWASTEDLGAPPRAGFEFAADNTLAEQEQWTIDAINFMRESDFVQIATLWNLNYGPLAGWNPENDNVAYSIIGKDWNFRPVYGALQEWTSNNS